MNTSMRSLRGFTLIEVLVALAIVSVMLAALYSTFFLSSRAVEAVDDSLVRLQECRALVDTLKREIEAALYDPDPNRNYPVFKIDDRDFYGKQASRLTLTAFSPVRPGLSRISYEVVEDGGRLSVRKYLSNPYQPPPDPKGIELMEGVESFTIEASHKDGWIKTWDSKLSRMLPDEVRISVTVRTGREENDGKDSSGPRLFTVTDVARPRIGRTI